MGPTITALQSLTMSTKYVLLAIIMLKLSTSASVTNSKLTSSCSQPGQYCSNSSQSTTCCDIQSPETTECEYTDYDSNGNYFGTCCVLYGKAGCMTDSDCCGSSIYCIDNRCDVPIQISSGQYKDNYADKGPSVTSSITNSGSNKSKATTSDSSGNKGKVYLELFCIVIAILSIVCVIYLIRRYCCDRSRRRRRKINDERESEDEFEMNEI